MIRDRVGFESFEETLRIFLVDEKYILPKISAKAKSIIQHYHQNKTSNVIFIFFVVRSLLLRV